MLTFDGGNRKESLAEMWSEFLEQEVGTPKGDGSGNVSGSVSGVGAPSSSALTAGLGLSGGESEGAAGMDGKSSESGAKPSQ